jgi:hypothetical protein
MGRKSGRLQSQTSQRNVPLSHRLRYGSRATQETATSARESNPCYEPLSALSWLRFRTPKRFFSNFVCCGQCRPRHSARTFSSPATGTGRKPRARSTCSNTCSTIYFVRQERLRNAAHLSFRRMAFVSVPPGSEDQLALVAHAEPRRVMAR